MEDMEIEALNGRKVFSAKINDERDLVVLDTDKGILYLTWEGDCCAHCYLAHVDGMDALIGATITKASNTEWCITSDSDRDNHNVIENMGTKIKTTKGYVTLETRLEHNGYYGGNILVSDVKPIDQYRLSRYDKKLPKLIPLENF